MKRLIHNFIKFIVSLFKKKEKVNEYKVIPYMPVRKHVEDSVITLINNRRESRGFSKVRPLDAITLVAFTHTKYMMTLEKVSHLGVGDRRRYLADKVGAKLVGEALGYAYSTAGTLVEAWVNSEGHRNIIDGDFTHYGINMEKDKSNKWYATLILVKI